VDDRSPGEAVPPADPEFDTRAHFYTGRVNRDLGTLSNVGIIYADREYLDSFNRAGGMDYRARVKNRFTLTGQAVTSATQNISNSTQGEQACEVLTLTCSGQSYSQQVDYSSLHDSWWSAYSDTSAGYVTDTGFFRVPMCESLMVITAIPSVPSTESFFPTGPAFMANEFGTTPEHPWTPTSIRPTALPSNVEPRFPLTQRWERIDYGLSITPPFPTSWSTQAIPVG
jgi:hypothetical protein